MDGLKVKNLHLEYGLKKVFCGVSFDIGFKESAFFYGKSGQGKSLLARALCGLIPGIDNAVLRGEISFCSNKEFKATAVLQDLYAQILTDTADYETSFYAANSSFFSKKIFMEYFSFWGQETILNRKTSSFSAGELQKYLISCACAFDGPGVVIFDEAFSHFDENAARLVPIFLKKLKEKDKTLCFFSSSRRFNFDSKYSFKIENGNIDKLEKSQDSKLDFDKGSPCGISLKVKELSFSYGNENVFSRLSLTFYKGCLNGLYGPNGCGKTTLAMILASFLKGYSGKIDFSGLLFLVPSYPYSAIPGQTLAENACLFLGRERGLRFLSDKGYKGLENLFVSSLSYSSAQKFLADMAIETSPDCLIIDEPLWDENDEIFYRLSVYARSGGCPVIISHNKNLLDKFCLLVEKMV